MTVQPLALRHVTFFTCRFGATALGRASARYLAGVATTTRWARQLLRNLAAADNIHNSDNHGCEFAGHFLYRARQLRPSAGILTYLGRS